MSKPTVYDACIIKEKEEYFIALDNENHYPIFRLGKTLDDVAHELGPNGWFRPYLDNIHICISDEEELLLRQKVMMEKL